MIRERGVLIRERGVMIRERGVVIRKVSLNEAMYNIFPRHTTTSTD